MGEIHDDGIDTSFKSIRRNLNFMICLMLILAFGKAEIKELVFLGNKILIQEHRFYIMIWMAIFYLLLRYLHHIDWKLFNRKLSEKYWHFFKLKSITNARKKDANYFLRKAGYLNNKLIQADYEIVDPKHPSNIFQIDIKYIDEDKTGTIHLKQEIHRYIEFHHLLIKQVVFSIKSKWFLTLYLPLILLSILLSFGIFDAGWKGNFKVIFYSFN